MGAYRPLLSLSVEHNFFTDEQCPVLNFIPTAKSEALIANLGLVIRRIKNGVCLLYDEGKQQALKLYAADELEPLCFAFKAFSRDPFFAAYTELHERNYESMLLFDNRIAAVASDDRFRLHEEVSIAEDAVKPLSPLYFYDKLNRRDRHIKPVFIANFQVGLDDQGELQDAREFYLRFDAKAAYWKYCLMGDKTADELFIAGVNNKTEFKFSDEEVLPDKRSILTFRSQVPIPFQKRSKLHFQLKEKGAGDGKILMKQLPVASAENLIREEVEGIDVAVSEIYVNY